MRVGAIALWVALLWAASAAPLRAQGWDEEPVEQAPIVDPELADVAPAPAAAAGAPGAVDASGAQETQTSQHTAADAVPMPAPATSTGEIHTVLRSRTGFDLRHADPRQDVLSSTQLLSMEATVRPQEGTRFVVGLRPMHRFMTRAEATSDARAARFELDVLPGPAYADLTVADGVHLRLGYQYLHLGRFDLLSATNVLSAADLRDGPVTLPEAAELTQPAVRVDWDPNLWLSLRAVYVPFFQSHIVALGDGDYALFPSTQAQVDAAIDAMGATDAARFRRLLLTSTSRAGQEGITQSGLQALSPVADISRPQGAVRATAHGPQGEVAATVAIANERLPAIAFSRSVRTALDEQATADVLVSAITSSATPVEIVYNRFAVASIDGATHLGPVQVGTELAYMFGRTFFAVAEGRVPVPQRSDVVHAGLRVEYLRGESLALATEAMLAYALQAPTGDGRQWLMLDGGRWIKGIVALASWAPGELGLTLELGGAAISGPSYALLPRAQYALGEGLLVELGAALLFGPAPPPAGGPDFSLAGQYADTDQVFVGLRYAP